MRTITATATMSPVEYKQSGDEYACTRNRSNDDASESAPRDVLVGRAALCGLGSYTAYNQLDRTHLREPVAVGLRPLLEDVGVPSAWELTAESGHHEIDTSSMSSPFVE